MRKIFAYTGEIAIALYFLFTAQYGLLIIFLYLWVMLFKIDGSFDFIRKLVRVYQSGNEAKLMAIMRKLKISNSEMQEIDQEIDGLLSENAKKSLQKDASDLLNKHNA